MGDSDARAFKGKNMVDDIEALLAQSSALYNVGKKPLPHVLEEATLQQEAREQQAAEREKEERQRALLHAKVAANAASKSALHQAILEKLEDLRGDRAAQIKFDEYIGSIRRPPEQQKVRENIRVISHATPAEFARNTLERQTARRQELSQRRKQARIHFEARSEARVAQLLSLVAQRHEHHELGVQRQKAVSGRGRALMWLTVVQLHHSTTVLGGALLAGRKLRELVRTQLRAVGVIKKQFRLMVLRKRIKSIGSLFKMLRRLVWWWRFRGRIVKKRVAISVLLAFMRAYRLSSAAMQLQIKRFVYLIRVVQRGWRRYSMLLMAQVEMTLAHWGAVDQRQQVRRQDPAKSLDPRTRLLVVRDDLRRRKKQHVLACVAWERDMATWEKQLQQEELMLLAKGLLAPDWEHPDPATDSATAGEEAAEQTAAEQLARRLDAEGERNRARETELRTTYT